MAMKNIFPKIRRGASAQIYEKSQDNSEGKAASENKAVSESKQLPKNEYIDNSTLIVQPKDCYKVTIWSHPNSTSLENDNQDKTITITITGKNLYNGSFENGYLGNKKTSYKFINSMKHKTTDWFPVLAKQGGSLVLSGTAHNRSVWQFRTAEGRIISAITDPVKYKIASDMMQDRTVSKVDIPEEAVAARVYFACLTEDNALMLDDRLQIEYGKVPTAYQPYQRQQGTLPFIEKDSHIAYENLEMPKLQTGDIITISGPGKCKLVLMNKPIKRTGTYGVRWNTKDSNPVCERIGDASGLKFNYVEGESAATPYENDFDRIYPWSDIKVCAVRIKKDGRRKVTYSESKDYVTDGSIGNIMVEIPRFYCKREVIEDFEYLWISATEQEGFTLDPSFLSADNVILEKIYIGAYLSKIFHKRLISISNAFPMIKKSMEKLRGLIENSKGFTECDLLAVFTVQRLFMVETAVLDSQSIFAGNVQLPYLLKDKSTSYYAIRSEAAANRIYVERTNVTLRFRVGDAVAVLNNWKEYKNKPDLFQREITEIHDQENGTLEIIFSGEPVNIIERETGITCLPCKTGETDSLAYITGSINGKSGHTSFKYRAIENFWGTVSILVDNAYVKNSYLYIIYPDGKTVQIDYLLPVQKVQLSAVQFGSPSNMIVKTMGYDRNNSLVMFPSEIGEGAITSGYYCDAWYNSAEEDKAYIITYGGAWDNKGYAGIFNYRATFTEAISKPYNGSRIMFK
ncbi:MAG TPA: hypothetical protein VJ888_09440 [Mobilitalea sp.]|nr:hypothetical protein [Mobilitalea sp.]